MIHLKNTLCTLLFIVFCVTLQAQEIRYGFKIGLNNANFLAENKIDGEKFGRKSGFHIGATAGLQFTDNFNVRAELLYSRRGTNYVYGTASEPTAAFRKFSNENNDIFTTGVGDYALSIDNSYLEFPITARFRYKKLEIGAGVAPSLLVGSVGDGALHYIGANANGATTSPERLEYVMQYNYRKDKVGEAGSTNTNQVSLGGKIFEEPLILNAYTDFDTKPAFPYNRFDLGAIADVNYFFNSTLYLQARVYYGLSDISNNESDFRLDAVDTNEERITSSDFDRNFMIQASVGFSF